MHQVVVFLQTYLLFVLFVSSPFVFLPASTACELQLQYFDYESSVGQQYAQLPDASVSKRYYTSIAFPRDGAYTLLDSDSVPPGIVYQEDEGTLSGIPTLTGTYSLAFQQGDSLFTASLQVVNSERIDLPSTSYFQFGPESVTQQEIFVPIDCPLPSTGHLYARGRIYYPTSITSTGHKLPVIVFQHGQGTPYAIERYSDLLMRISSYGYVVIGSNMEGATSKAFAAHLQRQSLAYAATLNGTLNSPFFERLDLERVVLAGHSVGGLVTEANSHVLPIKGRILFDTSHLSSITDHPDLVNLDADVTHASQQPALYINADWDNSQGGLSDWQANPGHTYIATPAGSTHLDFLDYGFFDPYTPFQDSQRTEHVHQLTAHLTIAFLKRFVEGDSSQEFFLSGKNAMDLAEQEAIPVALANIAPQSVDSLLLDDFSARGSQGVNGTNNLGLPSSVSLLGGTLSDESIALSLGTGYAPNNAIVAGNLFRYLRINLAQGSQIAKWTVETGNLNISRFKSIIFEFMPLNTIEEEDFPEIAIGLAPPGSTIPTQVVRLSAESIFPNSGLSATGMYTVRVPREEFSLSLPGGRVGAISIYLSHVDGALVRNLRLQ
ncbi:MAG: hypothetical protein KDD55_06100 [Bdellovibrionales bacterium]|nr:hypothetical protein [Bdellovibrionales bacterium]